MAFRASFVVLVSAALAVVACQQLPESAEDDDGPVTTATDGTTGGGSFLPISSESGDPGGEAGESECDPVAQTGCGADERCTAQKVGASVVYTCVADTGIFDPFGSCTPALTTGDDGCPAAYACLGTETQGACVPLCLGDGDCSGGVCRPDPFDFVPHCANDCSPFEPSCPSPLQCRRHEDRFACSFAREEDVGVAGDPCMLTDDAGCASGFACIPGELVPGCTETNCCTPLCDLGGADPCPSPTTCALATESPAPGFEHIGACFVPA
jgi:hypothetical protein